MDINKKISIKDLKIANSNLFKTINKFCKNYKKENLDLINDRLLDVDNLITIENISNKLELIYITLWSILNIFIEENNLTNLKKWEKDKSEIYKLGYKFFKPESKGYFSEFLDQDKNYTKIIKYSYSIDDKTYNYFNNEIRKPYFCLQLHFISHKQDDIKFILGKLNILRNKLTLTHGAVVILSNRDCLLMLKFLDYLFKIPYNLIEFKLDLENAKPKSNYFEISGEVKEKKEIHGKNKGLYYYLLIEYKSNNKPGKLFIRLNYSDYANIEIDEKVKIEFDINLKSNLNNIYCKKISKLIDINNTNKLLVYGYIEGKNNIETYPNLILTYNSNLKLKISVTKEICHNFDTGNIVEIPFYCNVYENKEKNLYFNNIVANSNSISFLKNDISFENILKGL